MRIGEAHHEQLREHLYPGDGLEAVALVLCGRTADRGREGVFVHHLEPIPYAECTVRSADEVRWSTARLPSLLARAARENLALLKIHSHPGGYSQFSDRDDDSDRELFPGVYAWTDTERPHLSAIMLPDGSITARVVQSDGAFVPVEQVALTGRSIKLWPHDRCASPANIEVERVHKRTAQAFGTGTTQVLRALCVAIIGCSGTGSWLVELLSRLGVGRMILVDPDVVEEVNLNRILHATKSHAQLRTHKVEVLRTAILQTGLSVDIETHATELQSPDLLKRIAQCDVVFGCVDSLEARHILGRLAQYYLIPYIDIGVRLQADGLGGVEQIVGSVNYVHASSSTLLDRGLYDAKSLADEGLRRVDPRAFADQVERGYIRGANVERPAVASINALFSSLAATELLARLHQFRDEEPEGVMLSLSQLRLIPTDLSHLAKLSAARTGRGDVEPMLGLPSLSEKS